MNNPFGDPFVIEVEDLFAQHEIFEQRGPALPSAQAVLIIRHAHAAVGGQMRQRVRVIAVVRHLLMRLACIAQVFGGHRHAGAGGVIVQGVGISG